MSAVREEQYAQRLTAKCIRITYQDAMRVTVMIDDAENMASSITPTQWEELRKKARQLENEIDLKLVSFSKLGTNYSHHNGFKER
ncbi:Golgi SNAP receptor complex member 1 [Desmophyllum pertusum]|uniref:Golgi SNAP receptor complex member 1 n=1 Tax=Desmophyllum pertusum TaxID=174260 RepID=A0A9W9ZU10_9CNID|nr:Golgi SNAP receptor complex member 1 [Desmophyllum pertusum]